MKKRRLPVIFKFFPVATGILLAVFNVYIADKINNWWYNKVFDGNWREHYPKKINLSGIKQFFKKRKI